MRDAYYIGAHCAILMFDVTSRITYKNIAKWYKDLTRICDSIPICLVGNKVDSKDRKVKAKQIIFHRKKSIQYYDVSAKCNYNFEKPFVWILRKIVGDSQLILVESPALVPPEIQLDQEHIKQLEKEVLEASQLLLPEDDQND